MSADVALADDPEPVLGSFTVEGLTYAVTGEGEACLVAVAPGTLAGGLAGDSVGAEGRRGIGSGVPPRSAAEQVPSGATSPQPQPTPSAEASGSEGGEGTSDDSDGASLARIAGSAAAALLADDALAAASPAGSADGPVDSDGASEPATLVLPGVVAFDGIGYSLIALGPRALAGCAADVVVLPASVASVDPTALSGCSASAIEVAGGSPYLSSYDGMLFDADKKSLLLIPEGKQGAARIPKEAEEVDASLLSHSEGVSAVSVEAGSAAFTSRNGCLYDETGDVLLWASSDAASKENPIAAASAPESPGVEMSQALLTSSDGDSTVELYADTGYLYVMVEPLTEGYGPVFPNGVQSVDCRRYWYEGGTKYWNVPLDDTMYYSCSGYFGYIISGERAWTIWTNLGRSDDPAERAPERLWSAREKAVVSLHIFAYDFLDGKTPSDVKLKRWSSGGDEPRLLEVYDNAPTGGDHGELYHKPLRGQVDGSVRRLTARFSHSSNLYANPNKGKFDEGVKVPTSYDSASEAWTIPEPKADDAAFAGWQLSDLTDPDDPNLRLSWSEAWEVEVDEIKKITLYKGLTILPGSKGYVGVAAQWNSVLFLNPDGGRLPGQESGEVRSTAYKSCQGDVRLVSPEWPEEGKGVAFAGWQIARRGDDVRIAEREDGDPQDKVYGSITIKAGSVGILTVKAVWASNLLVNTTSTCSNAVVPGYEDPSKLPRSYLSTDKAWTFPEPQSEDAVFAGWQLSDLTDPDDPNLRLSWSEKVNQGGVTLYKGLTIGSGSKGYVGAAAHWVSGLYFNLEGGTYKDGEYNFSSYASCWRDFALTSPVWAKDAPGPSFAGWQVLPKGDNVKIKEQKEDDAVNKVYPTVTIQWGSVGHLTMRAVWKVDLAYELAGEPVDASAPASWADGYVPPGSALTVDEDVALGTPVRAGYSFLGWAIADEGGAEALDQDAVSRGADGLWRIHPAKLPAYAQGSTVTLRARWTSSISVDAPLMASFLYEPGAEGQSRTAYAEGGALFRNQAAVPMEVVGLESEMAAGAGEVVDLAGGSSREAKVLSLRPADEAASSEAAASGTAADWGGLAERVDFAFDDLLLEASFAGKGFEVPAAASADEPGTLYVAYRLNLAETGSSIDYDALLRLSPPGGEGSLATARGAVIERPVPLAKVSYTFAPQQCA